MLFPVLLFLRKGCRQGYPYGQGITILFVFGIILYRSIMNKINTAMDKNYEHEIAALNDLLKINLDRIEGYRTAINESQDFPHLVSTFRDMETQSKKNLTDLRARIYQLGGDVSDHTTLPGKIYHTWMEVRIAFAKTEKTVLELCEFGEDAALKAYKMALSNEREMDHDTKNMITGQQSELQMSHDLIKSLRDAGKNSNQNI